VRKESPALQVILVCLVLKDNQDLEGNPVLMAIPGHQDHQDLHILLPQNTRNLPMSHRVTVLAEDQDIRHKITDHSRKNQELRISTKSSQTRPRLPSI
jgi:hypothetical protein